MDAGPHRVAVAFMKDTVIDNEDRNLYIAGAEILSLEGEHDPLLIVEEVWWREQVRPDFLFGGNIFAFDRFEAPRKNALYKERFRELLNYAPVGFYWRSYERKRD